MLKALELFHITKQFSAESVAIKNLSLSFNQGEIMVLIGESGSGKTTLLRTIAGLEQPDQGEIIIHENKVFGSTCDLPPEKRKVGLVFQDYALFPHLNIWKNVIYGLNNLSKSQQKKKATEMLELCNLLNLEHRFPHELSGGQQQRVALARALAPAPDLLLLDEPFSNLDPLLRETIRKEICQTLKQTKTSSLIVTHDTRDAFSIADQLAVLKSGELQQVGTPEEVYLHSADEYTANLFGKINRIPCQLFNQWQGTDDTQQSIVWVRPKSLEITQNSTDQAFLIGTVISSEFCGDHREIIIECEKNCEKTQVTLFSELDRKVEIGSSITIRRKEEVGN